MADDVSRSGADDVQQVDPNSEADVSYWSDKLGIPTEQLRDLIGKVGPKVQDLQRVLGKYTPTSNLR
jgi:hypothetical protein